MKHTGFPVHHHHQLQDLLKLMSIESVMLNNQETILKSTSKAHTLEIILYNIHYLIEQNSIVLSYPRHLAAGNTKTLKKIFFPIFNYIQN